MEEKVSKASWILFSVFICYSFVVSFFSKIHVGGTITSEENSKLIHEQISE